MLQTNIFNRLQETIIDFQTDYSAEIIASALENNGFPKDQIIYQPLGSSKRPYRKDLSRFIQHEEKENLLFLQVNREGLYDGLPEMIFHHPINNYSDINRLELTNRMQKYREEEKAARLFFLPYEQEFFNLRLSMEGLYESFDWPMKESKILHMMSDCWPIFKRLDNIGAYIFLMILPEIHNIRNNFENISKYLSLILHIPIKLSAKISCMGLPASNIHLEDTILGIDSILGQTVFDGEKDIIIHLGPLKKDTFYSFSETGSKYQLIEELRDFFIGANYFITIDYIYEKPSVAIRLGEEYLLGVDACI